MNGKVDANFVVSSSMEVVPPMISIGLETVVNSPLVNHRICREMRGGRGRGGKGSCVERWAPL
jgi:hypothetical protein